MSIVDRRMLGKLVKPETKMGDLRKARKSEARHLSIEISQSDDGIHVSIDIRLL